jgi:hypothetical protein
MTRMEAREEGYDVFAYSLLCVAVKDKEKFIALGNSCYLLPETMCTQEFTVYFLAIRKLVRLTRKERGSYLNLEEKKENG